MAGQAANPDQLLPARRILVMRYRFIGDTILTVPFLRNLRRAYPAAKIDVLVGPQSGLILEGCPYVDELIPFDTTRFHKYDRGSGRPRGLMSYALDLRKRRYDLIFVLKKSLSSALLAWFSGARYRVGHSTQGRRLLLTHSTRWSDRQHEVEITLDLLKLVHVPVLDDHLECWPGQQAEETVRAVVPELERPGPHVLIHAAAAHPAKMYPLDHWASIIKRLARDNGARFYFTGALEDKELYEHLQQLSGTTGTNLAGRLSLRESLALLRRMDLAVCVDSGPVHMAVAAGTPTVALFGPTDPVRWRPWGAQHVAVFDKSLKGCPCQINNVCAERPCLTRLAPELVLAHCASLFKASATAKT